MECDASHANDLLTYTYVGDQTQAPTQLNVESRNMMFIR